LHDYGRRSADGDAANHDGYGTAAYGQAHDVWSSNAA
jgi:hypothetical protein